MKEREALLERRMEIEKKGRRSSMDSTKAAERIQKRRLKKMRRINSNLKKNRVEPDQRE